MLMRFEGEKKWDSEFLAPKLRLCSDNTCAAWGTRDVINNIISSRRQLWRASKGAHQAGRSVELLLSMLILSLKIDHPVSPTIRVRGEGNPT